jgi:hypothetical protein
MNRGLIIAIIVAAGIGGWWVWNNDSHVAGLVGQYVDNSEFLTLEARYTAEKIMEQHAQELLGDGARSFQHPELKFHPYVMLDVKYNLADKKTREGIILWSLVDGEMVIDSDTWDKTYGFEDAINAKANRNDFKILTTLAKNRGRLTVDQLSKELNMEPESVQPWITSAREKHLIVQKGNDIQLHFQNPKILVNPQTKINQWLVSKPYNHAQKISRKYSSSQIQTAAQAAFGSDFTIRNVKEVFVPVYSIEVLNPDGSILTSYWNALNGQQIIPKYMLQTQ